MALTPGLLLDGASGFVLIAFGILALLVRPRRSVLVAFSVFAVAFGLRAIWFNLVGKLHAPATAWIVTEPTYLAASVALVAFTWTYLGGAPRRDAAIAAVLGLVPPIAIGAALSQVPGLQVSSLTEGVSFGLLTGAFYASLALLALRIPRESDAGTRAKQAFLGLALVPYPLANEGLWLGGVALRPGLLELSWFGPALLLGPLAITALWLRATERGGWRAAAVAIATPALVLLGEGLLLTLSLREASDSGLLGAARTLTVTLIAFAFARRGLLEGGLAVRRGTLATGLLALVLIVAQVAQNFLQAEYGLLMGGVVAGAFLFMAAPLQRMIEGGRAKAPVISAPGNAPGAHDEAYRAAIRVALRDRRLTREEEVALADIAERLGIGARRAAEIRHDVEQERGLG